MPRVVVVGGGHNGLVCAAYLARAGVRVALLERRDLLGGACVTEECWPGYRVSRAAYVVSLLRPRIVRELELERRGLALLPRAPASFTPLPDGRSLVLGAEGGANVEEIGRFSKRDAQAFPRYEALLERVADAVELTLDGPPPDRRVRRPRDLRPWARLLRAGARLGADLPRAARLLLAPAREILEEWFESEPLRATLATDAVIGAFAAPSTAGTGYVLLHHVMGSVTGARGVWAYVRGGMGALADAVADAARSAGAELRTGAGAVALRARGGRIRAVALADGEELEADAVVSSLDPARTFALLDDAQLLPDDVARALRAIDYRSPVVKLNLALRGLPRFRVSDREEVPLSGTIHVGATDLEAIELAFEDARGGRVSERPVVELTIPSVLDPTLAPPGRHVAGIFAQYAPALAMDDPAWPDLRERMRDRAIETVDGVAPGFAASIEHVETLAPPDLERIFGLTGGNIFHGAMTPDRLFLTRPVPGWARYATPVPGLFLCGSGTHPGGGVMGAPGRNAALTVVDALKRRGQTSPDRGRALSER